MTESTPKQDRASKLIEVVRSKNAKDPLITRHWDKLSPAQKTRVNAIFDEIEAESPLVVCGNGDWMSVSPEGDGRRISEGKVSGRRR